MGNNVFEVILSSMGNELSILMLLFIPILFTLYNIFRYIFGFKTFGLAALLSMLGVFFFLGQTYSSIPIYSDFNIGLVYGISFIIAIFLGIGLAYFFLKKVQLHYLPKKSIVLVFVIFVLIIIVYAGIEFNMQPIIQIKPITILLLLVLSEQIYSIYIKKSFKDTLSLIIQNITLMSLCYLLITRGDFQLFILKYSWIVFLTIPINFLIGRYTGLRFSEYIRFFDLLIDQENEDSTDSEE